MGSQEPSPIHLALSCEMDFEIAAVLRAKMALPHQTNPPAEWGAIGNLAALRFGALAGFSDGRSVLWSQGGHTTRWELAARCDGMAKRIAEHGKPGQRPQATPRAAPLGGLRDGRMLWKLCFYRADHRYVADLLLIDVAQQRVDILHCGSERVLSGTEPKRVIETDAPDICYVAGDIDAGAAAHLDDFITVDTCWRVDLARGTYAWQDQASLPVVSPPAPLLACGSEGYVTGAGFGYLGDDRFARRAGRVRGTAGRHAFDLDDTAPGLPSDDRWFVHAVADQRQLLVLDLRAGNRADVYIGG